jgi:hypothetical protein
MQSDTTLADIIKDVWAARMLVLFFALVFALVGFLICMISTPLYRASLIIAPADGYALGDYASTISDGEALEIPFWRPREADGVSTDFHRFVFTVKGTAAAAILLKDPSVLSGIARDGRWAGRAESWSAEELADYLNRKVKIEHLGATPLRRISYHHPDPAFAAAFLRKIHLVADQLIRRDRRKQSESRIAYLQATLQKTMNPDHRRGIANLLTQQEHIQMLANLDEPYAAIIVEPPAASPRPVWPNKTLIIFVLTLVGGMFGYAVKAFRDAR